MSTSKESRNTRKSSDSVPQQKKKNQRSVYCSSSKAKKCSSSREYPLSVTSDRQKLRLSLETISEISFSCQVSPSKAAKEIMSKSLRRSQCPQTQTWTLSYSKMRVVPSPSHHRVSTSPKIVAPIGLIAEMRRSKYRKISLSIIPQFNSGNPKGQSRGRMRTVQYSQAQIKVMRKKKKVDLESKMMRRRGVVTRTTRRKKVKNWMPSMQPLASSCESYLYQKLRLVRP